ncbi:MAG: hypothetical protein HOP11_10855 [Saprospiraceae bacterium]|nr:hypothetical protein [Saprospiraceae bacterium]
MRNINIINGKFNCTYTLILATIIFSCNNDVQKLEHVDFDINNQNVPSILLGNINSNDKNFYLQISPDSKIKCKANLNGIDLIWKLNNKQIGIGTQIELLLSDTGMNTMSLHVPNSELFTIKYIYVKEDLVSSDTKKDTSEIQQAYKTDKLINCNEVEFHATEKEGVIYDLQKGSYVVKVYEGIEIFSYNVTSNGKDEVTWKWRKRHFPKPTNFKLDLYHKSKLVCKLKQSN